MLRTSKVDAMVVSRTIPKKTNIQKLLNEQLYHATQIFLFPKNNQALIPCWKWTVDK
jgi:hypothetical protein